MLSRTLASDGNFFRNRSIDRFLTESNPFRRMQATTSVLGIFPCSAGSLLGFFSARIVVTGEEGRKSSHELVPRLCPGIVCRTPHIRHGDVPSSPCADMRLSSSAPDGIGYIV